MSCKKFLLEWNETRLENELGNDRLQVSEKGKDLGLVIHNRLHNWLANMRVAFTYGEMVKKTISSFMRPTLQYAAIVGNPRLKKKKHREKIEKVQRVALW